MAKHARHLFVILFWLVGTIAAQAQDIALPLPSYAQQKHVDVQSLDRVALPIGVLKDEIVPMRDAEGRVIRLAWHIASNAMTPAQLLKPIRDALREEGYQIDLDCQDRRCGGFGFRSALDLYSAPKILVNLANFQAITAQKGERHAIHSVFLFASRVGEMLYLQLTAVSPAADFPEQKSDAKLDFARTENGASLEDALRQNGSVILSDLEFAPASHSLGPGPFDSLARLAQFLKAKPSRRVALVGHTDAVGLLKNNIALSEARANAVSELLIQNLGVSAGQLETLGAGYLAPAASNLTPEGRQTNRRVTAVLLAD